VNETVPTVKILTISTVLMPYWIVAGLLSPRKRGSMFLLALVCVSLCDHDN